MRGDEDVRRSQANAECGEDGDHIDRIACQGEGYCSPQERCRAWGRENCGKQAGPEISGTASGKTLRLSDNPFMFKGVKVKTD